MRTSLVLILALLAADGVAAEALVPVRAIRAQTIIAPEDVVVDDEMEAPGALVDPAEAIGREARVTLYPGRPITLAQIGDPAVVERNQAVRMSYKAGPLSIVTDGRALDRGAVGEPIRVMNLSSRQIVTGLVSPNGNIEVGP
jgi:flagellar basal body P-ring formation protein FlgA